MNLTLDIIESSYPVLRSNGYAAVRAYWVPMRYHDDVLRAYRKAGVPVRTRFRGPRNPNRMMQAINGRMYRRGEYSAQITCLKEEATHFTVYGR